ncbi:hypothetical protein SRABI83_03185 [Arthrobacter sp. Bi83]|nr:hypothetical protein SRABI83_03185 [Arthrobacter sp. Bi83]
MRQFVADAFERRFPDEFGDHHGLRFVRQVAVRIERRRRRHMADQDVGHGFDLEAVGGRDRDDVLPAVLAEDLTAQGGDGQQLLGQGLAVHGVGLGHDRDDGLVADGGELGGDELVARADLLVGRQAETDRIDLGEGVGDEFVEALAKQGARTVQARRVHQYQLGVIAVDDAPDRVAGGLRLGGGDGDFLAYQRVGQR